MLAMIAGNLHRDTADARLFEIGAVFSGSTERVDQRSALSIGLTGSLGQSGPSHAPRAYDFYDLKGLVEQLLARFKAKSVYFDSFSAESGLTPQWLHPYRAARVVVEGLSAGWFGELHPREASARKIKEKVLVSELWLDRLYALPLARPQVRELSKFQPVRRDFSLFVPGHVQWSQIDVTLAALAAPELASWQPREIRREAASQNRGAQAEYSLLLGVTFQALDRTLRDDELQALSGAVVDAVSGLGARLRS
jgi:phenylalanyl-tRNA synthetase beta chain